jgi:hypothetical protein
VRAGSPSIGLVIDANENDGGNEIQLAGETVKIPSNRVSLFTQVVGDGMAVTQRVPGLPIHTNNTAITTTTTPIPGAFETRKTSNDTSPNKLDVNGNETSLGAKMKNHLVVVQTAELRTEAKIKNNKAGDTSGMENVIMNTVEAYELWLKSQKEHPKDD